jgi:mannose-6-phosphate isomerase-like protein (cupin superfamily)
MVKIFTVQDASKTVVAGRGTTYRLINETMGAKRMGVMIIELEPNMQASGVHYHEHREAAYLVVEGSATLLLNGVEHPLIPNTVVFIPPGDHHGIIRTGTDGFKMIEVYAPLDPDRIEVES